MSTASIIEHEPIHNTPFGKRRLAPSLREVTAHGPVIY